MTAIFMSMLNSGSLIHSIVIVHILDIINICHRAIIIIHLPWVGIGVLQLFEFVADVRKVWTVCSLVLPATQHNVFISKKSNSYHMKTINTWIEKKPFKNTLCNMHLAPSFLKKSQAENNLKALKSFLSPK